MLFNCLKLLFLYNRDIDHYYYYSKHIIGLARPLIEMQSILGSSEESQMCRYKSFVFKWKQLVKQKTNRVRLRFICSATVHIKTCVEQHWWHRISVDCFKPIKGVLTKCTSADARGGTRQRRRERRGWVCEGEKGPGDKGRGTLIKSIFPVAVLRGMEKKEGGKWTDKRGCYGGQPGRVGWGDGWSALLHCAPHR